MCEVVGMELYWKLMVGLVCEVVTGFLRGCFYWMLVIESNSVNSGTEVLIDKTPKVVSVGCVGLWKHNSILSDFKNIRETTGKMCHVMSIDD